MKYLKVAEARDLPGLRLALTANLPGPWGEAAKAVFKVRGVTFQPVEQLLLQPNEELVAWTGYRNAPVAILDDEPAVANWHDILILAERLGTGPSLLPSDPVERSLALGFSAEICGPDGFGWNRRLTISPIPTDDQDVDPATLRIRRGYGLRMDAVAQASERVAMILSGLSRQIHSQRAQGSFYFVGDHLSACDLHWAAMSQMVAPLPHEHCPMPDWMRELYARLAPVIAQALDPILLDHRDYIFRRYVGLPLEF